MAAMGGRLNRPRQRTVQIDQAETTSPVFFLGPG